MRYKIKNQRCSPISSVKWTHEAHPLWILGAPLLGYSVCQKPFLKLVLGIRGERVGALMPELLTRLWHKEGCLCTGPTAKLPASSSSEECGQECSNAKPQALVAKPINHPQHPTPGGTAFETAITLGKSARLMCSPPLC